MYPVTLIPGSGAASPGARLPDLFIVGAPKCGTTSLSEWLAGHPEVFMSARKEPRYFAPDLLSPVPGKNPQHPHELDRYLALFAGARGEKRLGEASVQYLFSTEASRLIRDFQPRPYIVVMLRDPIEMMHSLHAQHVSRGSDPIADFEQALAAESERRGGLGANAENPRLMLYTERARFGAQLARWFDVFPRDRIHVMILDDLVNSRAATLRNLLEFLEVDTSYTVDVFPLSNGRHAPRIRLLRRVYRSSVPQFIRWQVLPSLLGDQGARALRSPLRGFNRKAAPRAPIGPRVRERLQEELADDLALASELIGRDLAALWWNRHPAVAGAPAEAVQA